jgi:hypothetical protein
MKLFYEPHNDNNEFRLTILHHGPEVSILNIFLELLLQPRQKFV